MNPEDNPNFNPPMPPGFDQPPDEPPDMSDEPPTNVSDDGVKHFCVIPPGSEDDYCGGCGKPWPCPDAVHLMMVELPEE